MDGERKYDQTASALLHYSSAVLQVRTLAIAQGVLLLAPAGYFARTCEYMYVGSVSVLGLFLSLVLLALHQNYYGHFDKLLLYAVELEGGSGPWTTYKPRRDKLKSQRALTVILHYGPFVLIALAFLALIAYSAIQPEDCVA